MDRIQKTLQHIQANPTAAAAAAAPKLTGKCACGSVSWEGRGAPEITFYCHCSRCRRAGGAAFVGAAGFKPENVTFHGETNIRDFIPPGSKVPRRFCKKCSSYVAEDARPVLGMYALPLGLCDSVDKIYRPAQHIFYDSRVQGLEVDDSLPKYKELPNGPRAD